MLLSHLRHPEVKVGPPVWFMASHQTSPTPPTPAPQPHTDHINAAEPVSVVYNEKINLRT